MTVLAPDVDAAAAMGSDFMAPDRRRGAQSAGVAQGRRAAMELGARAA